MIYLSGSNFKDTPKEIGFMAVPKSSNFLAMDGRFWAGDNGAFKGNFNEEAFFDYLTKLIKHQDKCLFIACPDVLADPIKTLEQYGEYSKKIKGMGYKVAFVCQDGQENYDIPECDAIFIGGTTKWKLGKGADKCIKIAKERGLWVHVGRVNTKKRIVHFAIRGVDSVDGTCIAYGPDLNIPNLLRWIKEANNKSLLL